MNSLTHELSQLLDREKIRDCLARLARGEDRRNAELISRAYWPGAIVDLGIFSGTLEKYLDWVVPGSPDIPVTQHVLGQILIDLHDETALVETPVLAYHRTITRGTERDLVIGGRYLDWMDSVSGDWRIAKRTMLYDWCQDLGTSADWSAGLMGMPFDIDSYAGRATKDPSEGFLGDRWPYHHTSDVAE
ncbi:nuclear transport factor 2 family protein [Mycobacterium sp. DL440]|uniref:nuclear transport factor 2 family protein n=1 Tax=Mycobacterium sp. DL440 TaxID=2675523 RepID=UPI00141EDC55|nr:nuclear transport factor 2 family protein [Mycobacterium sp. DL440]